MFRPGSAVKRKQQAAKVAAPSYKQKEQKFPEAKDFLKDRDYSGAITILELDRKLANKHDMRTLMTLAYAYFHNGDYRKAIDTYDDLMRGHDYDKNLHLFKACCLYAECRYKDAKKECEKAGDNVDGPLYIRLMFHLSHKLGEETAIMNYHQQLTSSVEDELCIAALHYLRNHYEEATEIYKKLLLENRDFHALNAYVALCYYKLDYYDVSLEILAVYLGINPNSIVGVNLKACNHYQLYNGKAAEAELKVLQNNCTNGGDVFQDSDLLRHNLVVFRGGEGAQQVLPPLIDIIPEARLNLVIYHLKNDDVAEAFKLVKDMEPVVPKEYIIKAVVHAVIGQSDESKEHLGIAQKLFQLVGGSATECDTIPGRQCMASCFFLLKQFDDVLVYLKSVKSYFLNDDDFNWNFGIASAAAGEYKNAEEALCQIQKEKHLNDYTYISWLSRCYIMNGKPHLAWERYINMETSNESLALLNLIANDCYKMGQFYYSVKAFDVLERLDPDPEFWDGKRGAAIGLFQLVVAGQETREKLIEVISMLRNTSNPQVEFFINVMKKWGEENGFNI
jgi:intraflagellar transport protein 56